MIDALVRVAVVEVGEEQFGLVGEVASRSHESHAALVVLGGDAWQMPVMNPASSALLR